MLPVCYQHVDGKHINPEKMWRKRRPLLVGLSNAQFATVEENASLRPFDTMEQIRTLFRLKITIEQPKSEQQSA
jgi:hypothetical protein